MGDDVIVLWLLVAHLVGDYLFQTRWQAAGKFGWSREAVALRLRHVCGYCLAFVPVAFVYGGSFGRMPWWVASVLFLAYLGLLHSLTDAQRFTRTPGEWLWWHLAISRDRKLAAQQAWLETEIPIRDEGRYLMMPPNPWPSIGLAIDQTLHLIQIAILAEVFLRR